MSEPENFLSRWSRRKRETEETPERADPAAPQSEAAPQIPAAQPPAATPPEEAFDPASLPSLDSIDAQTDIRAFLKTGVPSDLRLAALRRAWTSDPAIRDFKGLAENDWDFNDPNAMAGFGKLDPGTDVKKMLAQLFGETPAAEEALAEMPKPVAEVTPPLTESSPQAEPAPSSTGNNSPQPDSIVQREENIATQDADTDADDARVMRRRSQGSALPE